MKRLFIVFILFFIGTMFLFSLEFGADFRIGNYAFSHDRVSTDLSFPGDFFDWGLSLYGTQQISDNFRIDFGFFSDQILRNISYTTISYVEGIMSIGIGPFFGYFNPNLEPILKPGISANVKFDFPGLLFVGLRADSTLNTRLIQDYDYIQERTGVNVGFYVPNAICTLSVENKKFTQFISGNDVVDSLLEFAFNSEIYKKNTPYKINVGFAYDILSKTFLAGTAATKQTLGSIVLKTAIEFNITEAVFFTFDLDTSIYTYGYDTLLAITPPLFVFSGHTGIKINIDRFTQLGQVE
jgi:hypothetical protein